MKTALLQKVVHGQRVRTATRTGYSMEFADLLDGVEPEPVVTAFDLGLADLVMFPVPHRFDPQPDPVLAPVEEQVEEQVEATVEEHMEEPVKVSRFADAGLDDDLLPVQAPRRRLRR